MILYDHPASANCLKVRILLRQLGLEYETVTVDLFSGETRRPEHLARNPDGRVPVLELDSGELLPESAAILLYLAEGTPFLPGDRLERARVHQWLFFEQNQVEPGLAVARFMALVGRVQKTPEVFADRLRQGRRGAASRSSAGSSIAFVAGRVLHRRRHRALRLRPLRRRGGRGPRASTRGSRPGWTASRRRRGSSMTSSRSRGRISDRHGARNRREFGCFEWEEGAR